MKTTHELVAKRFADVEQDVSSATIWRVTGKALDLKNLYPQVTRERIIEVIVPDYRRQDD